MAVKSLSIKNTARKDLFIHDLGVKIRLGQTVDLYAVNSRLSAEQVETSLKTGDLSRRLGRGEALVIKKVAPVGNTAVKQVKEATETVMVRKTKTSVVVSSKPLDLGDGESLDFADYGFEEAGAIKTPENAVVWAPAVDKETVVPFVAKPQELIKAAGGAVLVEGFVEARSLAPVEKQDEVKAERAVVLEDVAVADPVATLDESGAVVMVQEEVQKPVKKTRKSKKEVVVPVVEPVTEEK